MSEQPNHGMKVGDVDECGRCGRHRAGDATYAKDVTVHTSSMPVGYWYLCDKCQSELDTFLRGEHNG